MIKCIIIDDEPTAIEGLKRYISSIPDLKLVESYTDPVRALLEISAGEVVDIIFIDINMPKISGIELSKEIKKKTKKIVFTTAYTQYGYEAFEVEADGYLLKPYGLGKFTGLIGKLFDHKIEMENTDRQKFFFIKSIEDERRLLKVRFAEVIAVESSHNHVKIHLINRVITTYMTLTDVSMIFTDQNGFHQFQRSFIISEEHIESIDGNTITMQGGKKITVGDYYKKSFGEFVSGVLINKTGKRV